MLFGLLVAARMCHIEILWEGDSLPLAAARQMLGGKTIYRDIWFDKPPLAPSVYLLWGARRLAAAAGRSHLCAAGMLDRLSICARFVVPARRPLGRRLAGLLSHLRFRLRGGPSGFRSPNAGAAPGGRLAGLEAAPVLERRARPTFVVDGLSSYNPRLAIANYPELRPWFANYREVARTRQTVIYRVGCLAGCP